MGKLLRSVIAISTALLLSVTAAAQKGTGETAGVAQQAEKPVVITLSGKLLEIKTGPCENTTGRSPEGTHLILLSNEGAKLNIHLGPKNVVDPVVDQLATGQSFTVEAFRSERLPENAYIAKSLLLDDKLMNLRDDNLRPSWANARGKGQGRGRGMGQGGDRWGSCW